mgnify:CR=1 FL=1
MKILLGASMYCTDGWGEKQHIVFLYIAGPPYVPLFTERYMYLVEPFKNFSATSASNRRLIDYSYNSIIRPGQSTA